jgi:endonuclease-3
VTGGTYSLVLSLSRPVEAEIGALGSHALPAGTYVYTGSARASGGFARVDRHRRVARGEHDVRHWHVDHLTGHPATDLDAVHTAPGADRECEIAAALPDGPVAGFGASDCGCRSHLSYAAEPASLSAVLASLYGD